MMLIDPQTLEFINEGKLEINRQMTVRPEDTLMFDFSHSLLNEGANM